MRHAVTIAFLAQNYPAAFPSEQAARDYDVALGDLEPAAALAAAREHYATDESGFKPTPGQLRARCIGGRKELAADAADRIRKTIWAWNGSGSTPRFDAATEAALASVGGIRSMLFLDSNALDRKLQSFQRAYKRGDAPALRAKQPPLQIPNDILKRTGQ